MIAARQRKRLARERFLIGIFLARQIASVVLLGAIAALAWKLPDRRMAYVMGPVALAFTGVVIALTIRFLKQYAQRKRRIVEGLST